MKLKFTMAFVHIKKQMEKPLSFYIELIVCINAIFSMRCKPLIYNTWIPQPWSMPMIFLWSCFRTFVKMQYSFILHAFFPIKKLWSLNIRNHLLKNPNWKIHLILAKKAFLQDMLRLGKPKFDIVPCYCYDFHYHWMWFLWS